MSRERAVRRAERERVRAELERHRSRQQARRNRRRELFRRWTGPLARLGRRRAWLLGRRSPGQRALIAGVGVTTLWLIWYTVDDATLRVAFSLLALLVLPLLAVVAFDRRM